GWQQQGVWRGAAAQVEPQFTVMTVTGGSLHYTLPDGPHALPLDPGLHTVSLPSQALPGQVTDLTFAPRAPDGDARVLDLRLVDQPLAASVVTPITGVMAMETQAHAGDALDLRLGYASPDPRGGTVTAALELYRNDPNGGLQPYGYWELAQADTVRNGQT